MPTLTRQQKKDLRSFASASTGQRGKDAIGQDLPAEWHHIAAFKSGEQWNEQRLDDHYVKHVEGAVKHYDYKFSGDRLPRLQPDSKDLVMVNDGFKAPPLPDYGLMDNYLRTLTHEGREREKAMREQQRAA